PDGAYTVKSEYEDMAGNRSVLPPVKFTVDTRPVSLAITAPKGFSPNGDGQFDTLPMSVKAGFYDTVVGWKLAFVDLSGKEMQVQEGSDALPRSFTWDGSMRYVDAAVKASEGRYTARLSVEYLKGNVVDSETEPFFVDVTPPAVSLQAAADPFIKTNGGMEGDIFITMHIDDAHNVQKWALDILSPGDEVLRSFTGTGDLQDQILWQDRPEKMSSIPINDQVVLK
ncbi:unnamed protein product, partial [marine sediment metagenome]